MYGFGVAWNPATSPFRINKKGDFTFNPGTYGDLTISSPEPGTSILLLFIVGLLFGLMMRKRIGKGLQQAT
jgi:hypothetical protein